MFLVANYFTIFLLGKTLDPVNYFKDLNKIILNRKFKKADFNPLIYGKLKKDIADLNTQIEQIDQEIDDLEMQKTGS